jgi:ankyrin repeat protein
VIYHAAAQHDDRLDDDGMGKQVSRKVEHRRRRGKSVGRPRSDWESFAAPQYSAGVDAAAELAAREYVASFEGDTPGLGRALVEAAREGNTPVFYELLAAHAPVDARSPADGSTALHWCVKRGALQEVALLLARKAPVSWSDARGWAPLHVAAVAGHGAVLGKLLEVRGVDCSQIESECNKTPLHWAAAFGHDDLVAQLLGARAEVHAVNHEGETALHDACRGGHPGCVRQLLAAGASADGIPPLSAELALASKSLSAALRLTCGPFLGLGGGGGGGGDAHSEPQRRSGPVARSTPLHLAARSGRSVECVAVLLGGGATVDALDAAGDTALHIAASLGDAELCERLLEGGAGVDARNRRGATPLMLAAGGGHCAACMVLAAYGADPFRVYGTAQPCSDDAAALLQHCCDNNDGPAVAIRLMMVHKAHVDGRLDEYQLLEAVSRVPAATAAGFELRRLAGQLRQGRMAPEEARERGQECIADLDTWAQRAARVAFPPVFGGVLEDEHPDGGARVSAKAAAAARRARALHAAAAQGDADTIMALLGAGADPNARDPTGATPLHAAAAAGAARACRMLLAGGADPCASREVLPAPPPRPGSAGSPSGSVDEHSAAVREAMDAPLFGRISALVALSVATQGETPADVAVGEARAVVLSAARKARERRDEREQQGNGGDGGGMTSPASQEGPAVTPVADAVPGPSHTRRHVGAGAGSAGGGVPRSIATASPGVGGQAGTPRPPSGDRATPVAAAPPPTGGEAASRGTPGSTPGSQGPRPPRVRTAW